MVKKVDNKRRAQNSSLKIDKAKLDAQERQTEKSIRLREEQVVQAQKKYELNILEMQLREKRLKPMCAMLSELSEKKYESNRVYLDELDWKHRIECDGTPNPRVVQELNTYLYIWRQVPHISDDQNSYVEKCLEIFNIISAVDDIIYLPLDLDQFKLQCFRETRDNLGRLLVEIVYGVCYHLLSDYERRMESVDFETVAYQHTCEAFSVGLHAVCHKPRLQTDDRPPPKCQFPECLIIVEVPPQLSQVYMAVMALWLRWDTFTDRMYEFDVSMSPELDIRDLWQYSMDMWEERNHIIHILNEEKAQTEKEWWIAKMEEKLKVFETVDPSYYPEDLKTFIYGLEENDTMTNLMDGYEDEEEQEPEQHQDVIDIKEDPIKQAEVKVSSNKPRITIDYKKTPSQEIVKRQMEQADKITNSLKYQENPDEINPRKYWVIGGTFIAEMWKLPMQPVEHHDGTVVIMIVGPSALQPIDYHEKYEPSQLSMGVSSTLLEDEDTGVKKQNQEALEKLTLINIKLPENILWFENPQPAMWNENKKIWMTDYIYDVRFNEELQTVSFRTGRMGSFGLAVKRYTNFPFQSWEVCPADDHGVTLSVKAAAVHVEFVVRDDRAAVARLQNAPTNALQEIVGAYHRPDALVRSLCRGGVNLFPEPDARHYVGGRQFPKHAITERHVYRCMAALSSTHGFAASRWNADVGADRIVLQMKEMLPAGPYRTVMVTSERAVLLKCNETSHAFTEEPLLATAPFAPDLLTLAADAASTDDVRTAIVNVDDFEAVETLFYLMDKIKFLSYS